MTVELDTAIKLITAVMGTFGWQGLLIMALAVLSPPGVLALFWYWDRRYQHDQFERFRELTNAIMEQYRTEFQTALKQFSTDTKTALDQYRDSQLELRQMYQNNVELVRGYEKISGQLSNLVMVIGETLSRVETSIRDNQFCPLARAGKGNREDSH